MRISREFELRKKFKEAKKYWTKALKYKLLCNCWKIFFPFQFQWRKTYIQRNIYSFLNSTFIWRDFTSAHTLYIFFSRERGCIWLGDRSNLNRNRPFQWKTFPVFMFICMCLCMLLCYSTALCHLRHSTALKNTHQHIK